MIVRGDTVEFQTTGRTITANCGILGLCVNPLSDDHLVTFEGYDGMFAGDYPARNDYGWVSTLTDDERRELGDYMMGKWKEFREGK